VARHQIDSFNNFLTQNLQKVVNEQRVIETDIEGRGRSNDPVWVELGRVEVKSHLSAKRMVRREISFPARHACGISLMPPLSSWS